MFLGQGAFLLVNSGPILPSGKSGAMFDVQVEGLHHAFVIDHLVDGALSSPIVEVAAGKKDRISLTFEDDTMILRIDDASKKQFIQFLRGF